MAFYRSVEFFWHDDYRGVNWEERLESDLMSCAYFLNQYINENANIYQLNTDVEKFSSQIASYPEEKTQHLKKAASTYIIWTNEYLDELIISYRILGDTGKFRFIKNEKIKLLENELRGYGFDEMIDEGDRGLSALIENFTNTIENSEASKDMLKERAQEIVTVTQLGRDNQVNSFKATYKKIFGEDI